MRPRRALRRLILEPALLVSLVDRSTPAQLVLDRTPWLCQFAQSHSRCFPRLRVRARNPRCLPWAKTPDVYLRRNINFLKFANTSKSKAL
jgi:hypothetical protein